MNRKHLRTLELLYSRPVSGGIKWRDIESLMATLGAEISGREGLITAEREGSRIGVRLFGDRTVFHRPHPSPDTDKGAVEAIRKWFNKNGVKP